MNALKFFVIQLPVPERVTIDDSVRVYKACHGYGSFLFRLQYRRFGYLKFGITKNKRI